jgi:hypothetical protein
MSQQPILEPSAEDDVQMPLGVGGDAAPAEEYVESKGPRFNTSTLALVASFAAALAVLYFLGLQNKPRAASATEVQHSTEVDKKIDEMIGSKAERANYEDLVRGTRSLVDKLQKYFDERMGAVDLNGNPFEKKTEVVLRPPVDNTGVVIGPSPDDIKNAADAAEWRKRAEEFGTYKLNLILLGATPKALINGKMVGIGDKLGSFSLMAINEDAVTLSTTVDDLNKGFTLKLPKKPM